MVRIVIIKGPLRPANLRAPHLQNIAGLVTYNKANGRHQQNTKHPSQTFHRHKAHSTTNFVALFEHCGNNRATHNVTIKEPKDATEPHTAIPQNLHEVAGESKFLLSNFGFESWKFNLPKVGTQPHYANQPNSTIGLVKHVLQFY